MVTLRTEAVAISPTASSASSLDSQIYPEVQPFATKPSQQVQLATDTITAASRMLSKQRWEELKPTIRHLYLDHNRTLKELAEYIQENHGIKPT
jgi:hypothetical protein